MLGSIIGGALSLFGASKSADAAGDASRAQVEAAQIAADTQKEFYDTTRADMMPYMGRGYQGLDLYAMNLGIMPPGSQYTAPGFSYVNPDGSVVGPNNPPQGYFPIHESVGGNPAAPGGAPQGLSQQMYGHFSGNDPRYGHFYSTPAYSMPYNAGLDMIDSSATMRGMNLSGNQASEAANYGAGSASQRWKDYMNMLASLSNIGQTGATSQAGLGSATAGALANQAVAAGDARASGYVGEANAWNQGINQIGGIIGGMS
jgi:hypothetical protein